MGSDDTTADISFGDKIQLDISIPKEKIYKSKTVTEDLELSTISKIDVVKPSAVLEQSTIPSSKHSKKKPLIKATPTESKYSSALKGKELEEDKFETKTPKIIDESKTVTEDLELSTISKIDVVKPSAIPEQSTIPSSEK